MANETLPIVAGPSREELFDALRLYNEHRKVTFTLKDGKTVQVEVHGIGIEDGSGQKWLLDLYPSFVGDRLDAYYDSTRRTGWLRAHVPSH